MNKATLWRLTPPILLMIGGFGLSSIPGTPDDQSNFLGFVPPAVQNLLHMPFFGLLAFLWVRSLLQLGKPMHRAATIAVLLSLAWGVLDEFHQYFVPGRYASLTDIALNAVGVLSVTAFLVHRAR